MTSCRAWSWGAWLEERRIGVLGVLGALKWVLGGAAVGVSLGWER